VEGHIRRFDDGALGRNRTRCASTSLTLAHHRQPQLARGEALAAHFKAETIIESGVQDFLRWLGTRDTVPLIQALQTQAETWRAGELQRARKLLAKGEDIEAVLEALSRGITQKMLHGPMAGLQATDADERAALTHTLSRLFLQCPGRGERKAG